MGKDFLYCFCNFSVSLKLIQNKKYLKRKKNGSFNPKDQHIPSQGRMNLRQVLSEIQSTHLIWNLENMQGKHCEMRLKAQTGQVLVSCVGNVKEFRFYPWNNRELLRILYMVRLIRPK